MNTKGKKLAVGGLIFILGGPLIGLMGTVVGMLSAFQTMGSEGNTNAETLAHDVGFSLITTLIGLCIGIIGGVLMLIALFVMKYRALWFFWYHMIVSILALFSYPAGTLLGALMLVYLLIHKEEFKTGSTESFEPLA